MGAAAKSGSRAAGGGRAKQTDRRQAGEALVRLPGRLSTVVIAPPGLFAWCASRQ